MHNFATLLPSDHSFSRIREEEDCQVKVHNIVCILKTTDYNHNANPNCQPSLNHKTYPNLTLIYLYYFLYTI